MEKADIEYVPSNLGTHAFTRTLCDQKVVYQILKMDKSLFLWIGSWSDPVLNDLSVAMKTPYSTLPLVSQVLGSQTETASSNLATRLSKRLGKAVYVSLNLPADPLTLKTVEAQICDEIKHYGDKF